MPESENHNINFCYPFKYFKKELKILIISMDFNAMLLPHILAGL